jgi:hypothetical protein
VAPERRLDPREIDLAGLEQSDLLVPNAKVGKRAAPRLARDADHLVERVVRLARQGEHNIAWAQKRKQSDAERVRTACEAVPHDGGLCPEDVGVDTVERIPTGIVIAVSVRGAEHGFGNAVPCKCVKHARGQARGGFVDPAEDRRKPLLRLSDERMDILHSFVPSLLCFL